jgi:hypothetical protein
MENENLKLDIFDCEPKPATPAETILKVQELAEVFQTKLSELGLQSVVAYRYDDPLTQREWIDCHHVGPPTVILGLTERAFAHVRMPRHFRRQR